MRSSSTIQCELEPNYLCCGPKCIALGLNNHSWLYSSLDGVLHRQLQFVGSVKSMHLNDSYVAALIDGKVYLQHVTSELLVSIIH